MKTQKQILVDDIMESIEFLDSLQHQLELDIANPIDALGITIRELRKVSKILLQLTLTKE